MNSNSTKHGRDDQIEVIITYVSIFAVLFVFEPVIIFKFAFVLSP